MSYDPCERCNCEDCCQECEYQDALHSLEGQSAAYGNLLGEARADIERLKQLVDDCRRNATERLEQARAAEEKLNKATFRIISLQLESGEQLMELDRLRKSKDLTVAYMVGYEKGKDKMRPAVVKLRSMLEKVSRYINGDRMGLWHPEANAQADLAQARREINETLEATKEV